MSTLRNVREFGAAAGGTAAPFGRQIARSQVHYDQVTVAVNYSTNTSSVTDNNPGDWSWNFTVPYPSLAEQTSHTSGYTANGAITKANTIGNRLPESLGMISESDAGTNNDVAENQVAIGGRLL